MKQFLLLPLLILSCSTSYGQCCSSKSQHTNDCAPSRHSMNERSSFQRVTILAGGGPQYTLDQAGSAFPAGKGADQTLEPATTAQRLNFQAFGFLGYRFDGNGRTPHAFGLFGTYGQLSPQAMTETNAVQGLTQTLPLPGSTPSYRELELGFLVRNWFRISGGFGEQVFTDQDEEMIQQTYYTTTAGIHLPLGSSLRGYIHTTVRFGRDFSEFSVRPAAGLAVQLHAIRI